MSSTIEQISNTELRIEANGPNTDLGTLIRPYNNWN